MSDDLIREGQRHLAAATPAPWFPHVNDLIGGYCVMPVDATPASVTEPTPSIADFMHEADAAFIAWARNNLPALLDALKASGAQLADIRRYQDEAFVAIAQKQKRDRDRIAELERFVRDLAEHGTRFDLTPTTTGRPEHLLAYLNDTDASVRRRARALIVEPEYETAGESDV